MAGEVEPLSKWLLNTYLKGRHHPGDNSGGHPP